MKKQLKDYLHLYKKVPIAIYEEGCEPVGHYLEGIDWCNDKVIAERVNYDYENIKPILRPLCDVTKKEILEIGKILAPEEKPTKEALKDAVEMFKTFTFEDFESDVDFPKIIELLNYLRN